jgi:hypothetical protein
MRNIVIAVCLVDADPDDPYQRSTAHCWVAIPGRHRARDDAWDAFDDTDTSAMRNGG